MIAALLAQSRQAHLQAKSARREGRITDHLASIRRAQTLRLEAHAADPDHRDQAWAQEPLLKFNHTECLQFYATELAKDEAQLRANAKDRLRKMQRVVAESVRPVSPS